MNVWMAELPRSELRRGITRLAITWMSGWMVKTKKEANEEKLIVDEGRFGYLFHFSPSFPRNEPKNLVDSGLQLIYLFKHFMMEPNYQFIIPQLVLQYQSINPRPNAVENQPIYECIDSIFQTEHHIGCVFAGCVLAVIGALTYKRCNREFQSGELLLSFINEEFVSQLVRCQMPEFISAIINGAAHCLFSTKGVQNQMRQAAIMQLVQCDTFNRDFINQALHSDDKIERDKLDMWLAAIQKIGEQQLVRQLLTKLDGYFAMFKVVQVFHTFSLENQDDKDLFQQVFATFGVRVKMDEIMDVLDIVSTGSQLMHDLFDLTPLPGIIKRMLDNPQISNLSLYKRVLVTNYDFRLAKNVEKRKFIINLSEMHGVSFAKVVNDFRPQEEDFVVMFEKWMKSNCSGGKSYDWGRGDDSADSKVVRESSSLINKLDQELSQIIAISQLPLLAQKAIEYFNKRFPLSSRSLNSIVKAIDSVGSASLKRAYVSHQDVISQLGSEKSGKLTVEDLLRENERERPSWTREQLLALALAKEMPPSYEEVEKNFITPDEVNISWTLLMKGLRNYKNCSLARNLQKIIQRFTSFAMKKHLSIFKFLQLSIQSQPKLEAICLLMAQAEEREDEVNTFMENFQCSFSTIKSIDARITQLQQFTKVVISDSTEKDAVLRDITDLMSSYKNLLLDEFSFPPRLHALLGSAEVVQQYIKLGMFKQAIKQVQRAGSITTTNCELNCRNTIAEVDNTARNLLESLFERSAKGILQVLSPVNHWKNEINLLIIVMPNFADKLMILEEGLNYFDIRKLLKRNCKSLIKLQEVTGLVDAGTLYIAKMFVEKIRTKRWLFFRNPLNFQQMMDISRETIDSLYPEGNLAKYQDVFEVLNEFTNSKELTSFLRDLSEESLRHLVESVNDYDESTVTLQLIFNLELVWIFFHEAKIAPACIQLVKMIEEKLRTPEFKELKKNIIECSNNIHAIKEQMMVLEQNEMAKRKQIAAIHKSSILLFQSTNENYIVSVSYSNKPINLSYLQELKDRASLSVHAINSKEENSQMLLTFIKFVQVTQRTVDTLISLHDYGYPIDIAHEKKFVCIAGNFESLNQFQTEANEILQNWGKCIEDAYMRYYPLTFLFGMQFWTVETHLSGSPRKEAISLLSYMQCADMKMPRREVVSHPVDRLNYLGSFLNQHTKTRTQSLKIDYEAPANTKIRSHPGQVVYISVLANQVLTALVSAYFNSGQAFPQAHQLMHCSRRSQWAEVQAFLYRCFTCPHQEMFALIGTEQLPQELQIATRTLFAKLVDKCIGNNRFSLVVITGEDNSLLSEYFQLLQYQKCERVRSEQLLKEESLNQIIPKIVKSVCKESVTVVSSKSAGQGKSTWIQRQARNLQMFSIAGDWDLESICSQLLEVVRPNIVLHFKLSHVEKPDVLNYLLTYICLLRTVKTGNIVVVFPPTCKIFVEVQNLQPQLPLPFLHYLPREEVKFDIREICLTDEVKMVVAYLQLYDTNAIAHGDVKAVQVTSEMAVHLLTKHFIEPQKNRGQPLSFIAVHSFINVLSILLQNMEQSPFTSDVIDFMIKDAEAARVPKLKQEYENLRGSIVNSFLQTCEEVNTPCITQVKIAQKQALGGMQAISNLECTVRWDKSNHFSMIFFRDGSYEAIYRKTEDVPFALKKLIFIQTNSREHQAPELMKIIDRGNYTIPDYWNMTHCKALSYLQQIYGKTRDLVEESKNSNYVITQDNFLKMNLIYLRATAKLPIVIMGETGCGKTSLIRFFVQIVLRENLEIINIHAGITSTRLTSTVSEITKLASKLSTPLWVFFDEFNTSECVGQICEILCDRTFQGNSLPENIVLLAACNPYRLRPPQLKENHIGLQKSSRYIGLNPLNLMHAVKPLPESVIEYMWDFGALTENDSEKYVRAMLKQMNCEKNEELFVKLVCESQKYFQTLEDISSISLRDVSRFLILYIWFEKSLKVRKLMRNSESFIHNCKKYQLEQNWILLDDEELAAGILALCCCYYYRLKEKSQRQIYLEKICFHDRDRLSISKIENILRGNENDFLARMELPDNIALNQAFRENISCLLPCIFCKIALFICGKPRCSKSLAVQLVFSNLRGRNSKDSYFRTLSELVIMPFQGSESSTSEGIQKVFERAKKFLDQQQSFIREEDKHKLPVIIFDEIGLAELSKDNPLKVLHNFLELENRSMGFVAVSNWRLDASKMNRVIYLARPDPDG